MQAAALLLVASAAAIPDARFTEAELLVTAAYQTTFVRPHDGTDRWFIGIKTGTIRIVENGVLLPQVFATINPIYTYGVCGLVGLAADPDFATNHYLYAFVSVSPTEQQIIRFTEQNNTAIDAVPLLTGLPTIGSAHNGGGLAIGHDG